MAQEKIIELKGNFKMKSLTKERKSQGNLQVQWEN